MVNLVLKKFTNSIPENKPLQTKSKKKEKKAFNIYWTFCAVKYM